MKSEVDKLHVGKLKPVPAFLKKLSDVVDNGVVKKTVYEELVRKVFVIDTSETINGYNAKIKDIEDKIPSSYYYYSYYC